jgi:hypothetical protein
MKSAGGSRHVRQRKKGHGKGVCMRLVGDLIEHKGHP